ncbi:hypothetical protein PVAP13_9KG019320 [Panicum virgatum]|uniref:Uncharacterized protein n=1 Tax=Panicum virgatum TaxID=38727 RepID=A0A8T0N4T2_PANVG|nr:hypothetical protein PVAP13_9KG019320 [Panicum virgatum]
MAMSCAATCNKSGRWIQESSSGTGRVEEQLGRSGLANQAHGRSGMANRQPTAESSDQPRRCCLRYEVASTAREFNLSRKAPVAEAIIHGLETTCMMSGEGSEGCGRHYYTTE